MDRDKGVEKTLVTLAIDTIDADATGYEPVKPDGKLVGFVTSGAYGHHVGQSLALAYVDTAVATARPELSVDVIGTPQRATILKEPAYDPQGTRLRG